MTAQLCNKALRFIDEQAFDETLFGIPTWWTDIEVGDSIVSGRPLVLREFIGELLLLSQECV